MTTVYKNPAAVALGRLGGKAGRGAAKARTPEQARAAGKLGGRSGRGDAKKRSPEHYARLSRLRAAKKQRFASETKALTRSAPAEKIPE